MSSPREPVRPAPAGAASDSQELFERRVACSLVALPYPVPPAIAVDVVGVRRGLGAVVLCFEDRRLRVPIYLFVTPRDEAGPAFLRTEHLNLGYGATEATERAESLARRAASRLRATRFDELVRALEDKGIGLSPLPLSPGATLPTDERADAVRDGHERSVASAEERRGGRSSESGRPADRQGEQAAHARPGRAPGDDGRAASGSPTGGGGGAAQHERDTHDGLHETWAHPDRWRMFFADSELRRGRDVIIQCALPWIHIEHGDVECRYVGLGDFVSYPWRSPWERGSHTPHARPSQRDPGPRGAGPSGEGEAARPGGGSARREPQAEPRSYGLFTDMMDIDVIDGGRDKLAALFELVRELPAVELVSVNCTCVPQIIGDDVDSLVREERERCSFPILYRDQTSSTYGHHIDSLVAMLRESTPVGPDPHAVNLVGFREGPGLDELRGWLGRAGARVHVSLIPELRPELVRRYREAGVQVLCPNADWEGIYHHVVGPLELITVRPDPPYGVRRALGWLDEVLAATGVSDWASLRSELESLVTGRFEPLRARAQHIGVGLVLERRRVARLLDPARCYSLPLLGVLAEMGFSLHLAVFGDEADRRAVEAELAAASEPFERLTVTPFASPSELDRWLAEPEIRLVYSDYGYDYRLTDAGKAPFSAQAFEMGVEGAIRSLERLLRLAALPLYARACRRGQGTEAPW